MRTSKPISTISYNSPDFLYDTLIRLNYLKIISYFEFIEHLPDKDDKKKHIHLYIEPNKVLDTETFGYEFVQYVFSKLFKFDKSFKPCYKKYAIKLRCLKSKYRYSSKLKPLKCINWQNSKFGDWYWYALHDKDYLKSKMLTRNCFYSDKDIVTCDLDTHNYKVAENPLINYAQMSDTALRDYIYQCITEEKSLQYLLKTCNVPLGKIQSVIHFYNALLPYYSPKKDLHQKSLNLEAIKNSKVNLIQSNINDIVNGSKDAIDNDFVFDKNYDDLC